MHVTSILIVVSDAYLHWNVCEVISIHIIQQGCQGDCHSQNTCHLIRYVKWLPLNITSCLHLKVIDIITWFSVFQSIYQWFAVMWSLAELQNECGSIHNKLYDVHWVTSLFGLVSHWDHRWVQNTDWDQRSAKSEVIFSVWTQRSELSALRPIGFIWKRYVNPLEIKFRWAKNDFTFRLVQT